jgi:hypothetical protein
LHTDAGFFGLARHQDPDVPAVSDLHRFGGKDAGSTFELGESLVENLISPLIEGSFSTMQTVHPASSRSSIVWIPEVPPPATNSTGFTGTVPRGNAARPAAFETDPAINAPALSATAAVPATHLRQFYSQPRPAFVLSPLRLRFASAGPA